MISKDQAVLKKFESVSYSPGLCLGEIFFMGVVLCKLKK